jgi:hypothetical protein
MTGAEVTPSLVAVMLVVPAATVVTAPVLDTVATLGCDETQVTTRPVSTLPLESVTVAVNCVVSPAVSAVAPPLIVTRATAAGGVVVTVTASVPVTPSTDAVIVVAPAASAVTNPLLETVAVASDDELQVIVLPVIAAPDASRGVAENCAVAPTMSAVLDVVTATVATAGVVVPPPPPPVPVGMEAPHAASSATMTTGVGWINRISADLGGDESRHPTGGA